MLPPDLEKIEAKVKQGRIWFYWIVCFRLKNILFFTKIENSRIILWTIDVKYFFSRLKSFKSFINSF